MEFLKNLWANLADQELENDINSELQHRNTPQNSPDTDRMNEECHQEPFQVVKNRKRAKKAATTNQKKAATTNQQTY